MKTKFTALSKAYVMRNASSKADANSADSMSIAATEKYGESCSRPIARWIW